MGFCISMLSAGNPAQLWLLGDELWANRSTESFSAPALQAGDNFFIP